MPPPPPPPYDELAVDSPYLSFADNVFNKYRNYYHMQAKGVYLPIRMIHHMKPCD